MELKDYIEEGVEVKGSLAALARYLDQGETAVREAKAHKRGIPSYACVKLADLINRDPLLVIAAMELVTEKREERKAIWQSFVTRSGGAVHPIIAALVVTSLSLITKVTDLGNVIYNS